MKNDKIHEQDQTFFNVKLYLEELNYFLPEVSMFDRQTDRQLRIIEVESLLAKKRDY